jgi:hypothetical protein
MSRVRVLGVWLTTCLRVAAGVGLAAMMRGMREWN